ncbi:MAG: hypothetical protein CVV51_05915 [Spirochaetae bacterium HGW-Spirochaetae-7]|jgi:uncharacterized protein (TIGR02453 family)|nr:MAG: hypothetical protein CVV51_05915 [Spirochaetae bacterium HGW-Spirochaetae-7]
MAFKGFGPLGQQFFRELGLNNGRAWFKEHRFEYEAELRDPAEAFIADLGDRLSGLYPDIRFDTRRNGAGSLMRINRDIRFSPDKRPYKENLGIIFWLGEGKKVESPAFYFHVDADRCFLYGGQHVFPKETLARYRASAADDASGRRLVAVLDKLDSQGFPCFEEPAYKRVPRDYAADHARADLLRYSGMGVARILEPAAILHPDLVTACADDALRMKPLVDWLLGIN